MQAKIARIWAQAQGKILPLYAEAKEQGLAGSLENDPRTESGALG